MTDRYCTLTVVLEKDVRDDDAQALISAIQQLRGVLRVGGNISDSISYMAEERARKDIGDRLWRTLYPKDAG